MVFSPVQTFLFAPNQKQTFFSFQAKEQAKSPPSYNPHFSAIFVKKLLIFFLQFAEETIFSSVFTEQFFFMKTL